MAMPMQISLDEVLSMLLARVDSMTMANENMKSKFNILARALYKKGVLTDDDIFQSVKDEHKLMFDLGAVKEMPGDESLKAVADSIIIWLKNDAATIKKSMQEYEAKVKEMLQEEERKPRIDVASAADLKRLDRMTGAAGGQKSRLLVP